VPNLLGDGTQLLYSVKADAPSNTILERSETNNVASAITTISAPSDLDIISVTVEKRDAPLGPFASENKLNTAVTLKFVIKNNGPGQSKATTLHANWPSIFCPQHCQCQANLIYDFGIHDCVNGQAGCFDSCSVPNLVPNASVTVSVRGFRVKPFFSENSQVTATVDPNHQVAESNEGNNTFTTTFSVP
jgi:subtilase family serine protease